MKLLNPPGLKPAQRNGGYILYCYNNRVLDNITISIATSEDAPGITNVRRETWLATYPNEKFGITRGDIEEAINKRSFQEETKSWEDKIKNNSKSRFWVAKYESKVIGFTSAFRKENTNNIGGFYILPQYQRKGIGKQLLRKVLDWVGVEKEIHLEVVEYNTKAINFYKKFGFIENGSIHTETAKLPNGKDMPEIDMVKKFK